MHSRRRRLAARSLAALIFLTAVAALPSSAAAARGGASEWWGDQLIHEGNGFDCTPYGGAFTEAWHVVETISGQTFVDAAGEPIRDLVHVGWIETVSREDTGASIAVRGHWTVTFDHLADTISVTGAFRVGTAPAQGVLIHDAGRFAILADGVFIAGPHDVQFDPDRTYCAALASLGG